jgi:hypothetical protein
MKSVAILLAALALVAASAAASQACPLGQQKICEYNPALHRYMCWCA